MALNNNLLAATPNSLGPIKGFNSGFFQNVGTNSITRTNTLISSIITVFTIFGGLAFLFWFVIGALSWINSVGKPDQVEQAKAQMGNAIVGLILLVLMHSIIFVLGKVTGLDILAPENVIPLLIPK